MTRSITTPLLLAVIAAGGLATAAGTASAATDIPQPYTDAIASAIATSCPDQPGVTVSLVGAQIHFDSDFNAYAINSTTGTRGPAQFLPSEWDQFGVDANNNGTASPFEIDDAVTALTHLDCYLAHQLTARNHSADDKSIAAARYGGLNNVDNPHVREDLRPLFADLDEPQQGHAATTSPHP